MNIWSRRRSPIRTSRSTTSTRTATRRTFWRSTTQLPPEPQEIKPHPYGIELGQLVTMLKDSGAGTMAQFLTASFSRVSSGRRANDLRRRRRSARAPNPKRIGRQEADALYQAIQNTKIRAPATDCISPIGEPLDSERSASAGAGRVLLRGHASAGRVSRQSVPDRSGPRIRRRQAPRRRSRSTR